LAALSAFAISNARTSWSPRGASEGWSPVEQRAPHRAGLARVGSSRPAAPGHSRV